MKDTDLVVIDHPHGRVTTTFADWKRTGPGPRRLVQPLQVLSGDDERALPLSSMPLAYRNTAVSRLLIRLGLLRDPWCQP